MTENNTTETTVDPTVVETPATIYSQRELAAEVGLSNVWVTKLVQAGKLPTPDFQSGKSKFYTEEKMEQIKKTLLAEKKAKLEKALADLDAL